MADSKSAALPLGDARKYTAAGRLALEIPLARALRIHQRTLYRMLAPAASRGAGAQRRGVAECALLRLRQIALTCILGGILGAIFDEWAVPAARSVQTDVAFDLHG